MLDCADISAAIMEKQQHLNHSSIAVIIPTHDRDQYLENAIQSVISQTRLPEELIVVDDVGSAATREVVKAHEGQTAVSVRYVHNGHSSGAPTSRNIGVNAATGRLIAFLDDDDEWDPAYLDTAVTLLDNGAFDFVVTWCVKFGDNMQKPSMSIRDSVPLEHALRENPGFSGQNFIIRKGVFLAIGGFDPEAPMKQDWDLFVRLLAAGATYGVVTDRLVRIRLHEGPRISTTRNAATRREYIGKRYFYRKHRSKMVFSARMHWRLVLARLIAKDKSRPGIVRTMATPLVFFFRAIIESSDAGKDKQ